MKNNTPIENTSSNITSSKDLHVSHIDDVIDETVENVLSIVSQERIDRDGYDMISDIMSDLSKSEQEKLLQSLLKKGYIDIAVDIIGDILPAYRVPTEIILSGLTHMEKIYADETMQDYLLLSEDPSGLLPEMAALGFFDFAPFVFEKYPYIPKFSREDAHYFFDAYRKRVSDFRHSFLNSKDWKSIFSQIFSHPETTLAQFESFFQSFQYNINQEQSNYVASYQSAYIRTGFDILQKEDMRPSLYEEIRMKKFHKIIHMIGSTETTSGRILQLDFHSLSHGSRSVALDTAGKVPLGNYGNDIICTNKEAFLDVIWEVFNQYETYVEKWESPYTLLLVRQKGGKNTQPPAANDENYKDRVAA